MAFSPLITVLVSIVCIVLGVALIYGSIKCINWCKTTYNTKAVRKQVLKDGTQQSTSTDSDTDTPETIDPDTGAKVKSKVSKP